MRSRLCRHRSLSDRKSTRLNSSHSLHDALPIYQIRGTVILLQNIAIDDLRGFFQTELADALQALPAQIFVRSEEHTSELQSLPTRRSSDLSNPRNCNPASEYRH